MVSACVGTTEAATPEPLPSIGIESYSDVTVQLDFAHGNGVLPTNELDNDSPANVTKTLHAIAIRTDECMIDQGYDAIADTVDWTPFAAPEDRVLGRWSVEYASQYGADRSPEGSPASVNLVQYGVEFNKAYASCQDQAKQGLMDSLMFMQSSNMIVEIRSRAFALATNSEAGKQAIADWHACTEAAGIVLDPNDGYPVEEYKAQGKEAEIAAYTTHARCAQSSGAIQTIYNLRARYEQALMDSQQAAIAQFTTEQRKVLNELDKAIAGS